MLGWIFWCSCIAWCTPNAQVTAQRVHWCGRSRNILISQQFCKKRYKSSRTPAWFPCSIRSIVFYYQNMFFLSQLVHECLKRHCKHICSMTHFQILSSQKNHPSKVNHVPTRKTKPFQFISLWFIRIAGLDQWGSRSTRETCCFFLAQLKMEVFENYSLVKFASTVDAILYHLDRFHFICVTL